MNIPVVNSTDRDIQGLVRSRREHIANSQTSFSVVLELKISIEGRKVASGLESVHTVLLVYFSVAVSSCVLSGSFVCKGLSLLWQ